MLEPALDLRREATLRAIVLAGVAASAWFWLWWFGRGHGEWDLGSVSATGLLAWVTGLSAYFFFFACRMTRPNPSLPVPELRVAMVVTKAPSEPWSVLRRTLEAMLAQELPYPFDVWLADERPDEPTLSWCLDRGVKVCTRHGVAEYHRARWPRRTRSKEGNLSYFYDTIAYDRYDVVVQLDADHVPAAGYLRAMVCPFRDPAVGYVAAPSICDANADRSWAVRGRLYREASLHGPVQAGSNQGYGPVCIGSHYAVRTAALRSVGGLGPELAEDYSTSLWLLSGGWDGVFAIDAEAHGDGPESVEEMLIQERQWARSLATIMVRWAPARLRRVPVKARMRIGFALLFYPIQSFIMVCATVLPAACVLLEVSWGRTSLADFYLHLWPASLTALAAAAYLRRSGLLRPKRAKLWSWELVLFQLLRWPWVLIGVAEGTYAGLRAKTVRFRVTPKGETDRKPLHLSTLAPTGVLVSVLAAVMILARDPGEELGMAVLTGFQAFLYLGAGLAAAGLHLWENRRRSAVTAGAPIPAS